MFKTKTLPFYRKGMQLPQLAVTRNSNSQITISRSNSQLSKQPHSGHYDQLNKLSSGGAMSGYEQLNMLSPAVNGSGYEQLLRYQYQDMSSGRISCHQLVMVMRS